MEIYLVSERDGSPWDQTEGELMFPFWFIVGVSSCNLNTGGNKPFLFWFHFDMNIFITSSATSVLYSLFNMYMLSAPGPLKSASWPVCKETYFYTYMYVLFIQIYINGFQQEHFTELPPLHGSWHRGEPTCPWAEVTATLDGSSCWTRVAKSGNCTLSYNCREETDLKPLAGVLLPTLLCSPGLPCLWEE